MNKINNKFSMRVFVLILIIIIVSSLVFAHKDSSEAASSVGNYNFALGMIPANIAENIDQIMYLRAEDSNTGLLIDDLTVEFTIYNNNNQIITAINAVERETGIRLSCEALSLNEEKTNKVREILSRYLDLKTIRYNLNVLSESDNGRLTLRRLPVYQAKSA